MDITQLAPTEKYRNPWISVREDLVERGDGSTGFYGVVDKPPYSLVIPQDESGRLYLVEQFRYPVLARRWEFPAGSAAPSESTRPSEVARRELREETGLRAGRLVALGVLDVAPGTSSQRGHVFLATDLEPGVPERETEEQDMRGLWWTPDEFADAVRDGTICDAQTLAAYALLSVVIS